MSARGDRAPGSIIWDTFNTFTSTTGSLGTLSNGVLSVYKDGSDVQTSTGTSLTMNADGITGFNRLHVDTSDSSAYTSNADYSVILSAGSVGTTSAAGLIVTTFSLGKSNLGFVGGSAVQQSGGMLTVNVNDKTSFTLSAAGVTSVQSGLATAAALADGTINVGTVTAGAGGLIADFVWDEVIENSLTARQSLRINNAAAAGKLSGAASTNIKIRDLADSKDRIDATVDSDGNRTAVTVDAT